MSRLSLAQEFATRSFSVQSEEELFRLVEDATLELGFRYFALIHHVDLRSKRQGQIQLIDYPSAWADYFIENEVYADDPILRASQTTNVGFAWSEVPDMIRVTARHRQILEAAAKNGMGDGFTIPAHIPGESNGSCSFATRNGLVLPEKNLPIAQLIGSFAFQAAHRLANAEVRDLNEPRPNLTKRQRDCLILVLKGKTNWEVSRILGLSENTVARHLDMARERYGVVTRTQLAIHAIFDGQITFTDVLT